ncbi:membrane protein [gut metagenome]|uniref:Membrane protein n=1 Tax=gut metagenome TaxID=749906 RepID=J9H3G3_9ZZZZ
MLFLCFLIRYCGSVRFHFAYYAFSLWEYIIENNYLLNCFRFCHIGISINVWRSFRKHQTFLYYAIYKYILFSLPVVGRKVFLRAEYIQTCSKVAL